MEGWEGCPPSFFNVMKKFLPIFLIFIICFSLVPSLSVKASYTDGTLFSFEDSKWTTVGSINDVDFRIQPRYFNANLYLCYFKYNNQYVIVASCPLNSIFPNLDVNAYGLSGSFSYPFNYNNFTYKYFSFDIDPSYVYSFNFPFFGSLNSLDDIGSAIDSFVVNPPPTSSEIGFLKNLKYSYNGSEVVFSWDELTSNDFGYDGVEVNDLSLLGGLKTKFTGKSSGVRDIGYTQQYITQFPTRNTLGQLINSINAWLTNQDIADNYTQLAHSYNFYYFRPYVVENGTKYYGQWISAYYDSDAGRVEVTNNPDLNEPMTNVINNRSVRYIYSDEYYTIEGDEIVNNYDYSTTINNTYNYYTTNNYYYDSDDISGIDLSSVLKFITDIFNFFYKLVDFLFIPLSWLPSEIIALCKAILVGAIIVLIYKVINPFK